LDEVEDRVDIENENDDSATTLNINKRMKVKGSEASTSMMKNAFEILKTTASKLNKQPSQPDEVSSFFTYVSSKVQKYSIQAQKGIQHAMFEILMKADQGFYDIQHSYNQPATNLLQYNVHHPEIRRTEFMLSQQRNYQPQMPSTFGNSQPPQSFTPINHTQLTSPESPMTSTSGNSQPLPPQSFTPINYIQQSSPESSMSSRSFEDFI